MDRTFDATDVQATYEPSATNFTPISDRSYVPSQEDATNAATNRNLDGCEQTPRLTPVDELLNIDHWKPAEPQFCKEIAAHYGQSKRNIQKWFVDLREIAPWFSEAELRLSDDRYTPLAIELLGHRYFIGSKKKWATVLAARFANRIAPANASAEPPAIRLKVLPPDGEELPPVDRTAAGSFVPTGSNYLSALEEEELELQQLEVQELDLLERMSSNLERLDHNQTQWQRTNDLRRQRLLRQNRLEAAALATELEAEFEETLRESQYNIRRGSVGKCAVETPRSQSA
jgi:hypothetical protein